MTPPPLSRPTGLQTRALNPPANRKVHRPLRALCYTSCVDLRFVKSHLDTAYIAAPDIVRVCRIMSNANLVTREKTYSGPDSRASVKYP